MKRYAILMSIITFGYVLGWTSSVMRYGLSPLAFDRGPRGPRGPHGMFEGIGLNDDQKEAIRKIRAEDEQEKAALREKMEASRREFEKVLDSTQDLGLLQAAFDSMMKTKNEMEQAHFNSKMKIHQILTLEQIKKLGEQRPRGDRGGPRHGRRPPGEGPPPPPGE